jgi:hypothetical protein
MKNKLIQLLLLLLTVSMQAVVWGQTIMLPSLSSSIVFTNPIQNNNMFLGIENDSTIEGYTEVGNLAGGTRRKFYNSIGVYPNLIENLPLNIMFTNKPFGVYSIRLYNYLG